MDDQPGGRGGGPRGGELSLRKWISAIFALGLGLVLGYAIRLEGEDSIASQIVPSPSVIVKEVEVEKEVQIEVTAYAMPDDCRQAIKMSDELRDALIGYERHIASHKTLISEAGAAVALEDVEGILKADEELRKLQSESLDDLLAMRSALQKYGTVRENCINQLD